MGRQPWALSLPDKELCLREALAVCTEFIVDVAAERPLQGGELGGLAEDAHGQIAAFVDLGLDVTEREDPLEKGMATQSSILAWRIPWTEEPGSLQSMGYKESDMAERLN